MTESDNKKHTVSIIIINYNSCKYTAACVESIIAKVDNGLDYNIIIVDNNSDDNDYAELLSVCGKLAKVTLIRSVINLGFSGGNMLGVQHARADYLLFLNNDTVFLNDNVSLFLDFMLKEKSAGICTGQMYDGDGAFVTSFQHFPSVAQRILGAHFLRIFAPEKYPDNGVQYLEPQKVDVVAGTAMFVDFRKFAEVGGFDTNFFLYCEEEDIAMKLCKAGYSAYLVPEAKYVHYLGKSTARNIDIDKEFYISYFYYLRKHLSKCGYLTIVLYSFIKTLKFIYKGTYHLRLALFILSFPGQEQSLKHKQRININ